MCCCNGEIVCKFIDCFIVVVVIRANVLVFYVDIDFAALVWYIFFVIYVELVK